MKRSCLLFVAVIVVTVVFPVFALAEDDCFSRNVIDKVRCTNGDSAKDGIFDDRDGSGVKGYYTFMRKPVPPIGIRVGYLPSKKLNYLYWKAVPGAVSYKVYWGTDQYMTKKGKYSSDTQGMTAFSHTGVVNGGRYYYRVSSVMASGKESKLSKVVSTVVMADFVVHFPDPTLEAEVREDIGKPAPDDIMYSDLQVLDYFVPSSTTRQDIYDLEGLQYCTNLRGFELIFSQVSDLSPLAYSVKLEDLILADNQISDIRPLSGLVRLIELNLENNQISDIRPLAGLINLQILFLRNNHISDISIQPNWVNMVMLYLNNNQISDISSLSIIDRLNWLELAGNQISDIASLINNADLSSGDYIDLEGNPLNTLSCSVYVPQLIDRGVDVVYDCP